MLYCGYHHWQMVTTMTKRTLRIAVTLSPEALAVVSELADLRGVAKSALLAELVDETLPALTTMVEAFRVVKESPREAQRLMTNLSAKAVQDLMQEQLQFDAALDGRTVKGKRVKRKEAACGAS